MMGPVTFDESGEDLVDVLHAVLPPGQAVSPVPVGERTDWFGRTGYADILSIHTNIRALNPKQTLRSITVR